MGSIFQPQKRTLTAGSLRSQLSTGKSSDLIRIQTCSIEKTDSKPNPGSKDSILAAIVRIAGLYCTGSASVSWPPGQCLQTSTGRMLLSSP